MTAIEGRFIMAHSADHVGQLIPAPEHTPNAYMQRHVDIDYDGKPLAFVRPIEEFHAFGVDHV